MSLVEGIRKLKDRKKMSEEYLVEADFQKLHEMTKQQGLIKGLGTAILELEELREKLGLEDE